LLAAGMTCLVFCVAPLLAAAETESPVSESEPTAQPSDSAGKADPGLVKKLQNPVANITSVPFQNNTDFGVGNNEIANTLNIQPVIPVPLGPLNIINRIILPVAFKPSSASSTGNDEFGLGDMTVTSFFSPDAPWGPVIWGVGPVFYFPTATSDALGTDQFGAGPSLVVLAMPGKVVFGAVVSHVWSFAGQAGRPGVNFTTINWFVNYNIANGWYLASSPIVTANWEITSGNKWTVPLGAGIGKLVRIGKLPINFQLHGYGNVVKPTGGPSASMRFQMQFVLPSIF
jgi:hypothetical protein